jgi:hypothetical protein
MDTANKLRIKALVECWRCGCSWCPLVTTAPFSGDILAPIKISPSYAEYVRVGSGNPTIEIPYLRCDRCGNLSGKISGDFELIGW